jgi:DNA mismatch repair protein MutS
MTKKNSLTPMMEQYFRIKKNHKDTLLFFRLGDFYEMFYEDAKVASAVLEIALTSRQKVPMCGVPYHAVDRYLKKLLKRGFKIAICEQVEDAKKAIGVVKREVVKILTPGTALEIEVGEEKENTYIASLFLQNSSWGMAVVDLASGEIKTTQSNADAPGSINDEIIKFFPIEITFPMGQEDKIDEIFAANDMSSVLKSPQEDWIYDFIQAKNYLQDHFGVKSLAGFDLDGRRFAVSASGALLYYLKKLRKDSLSLIGSISYMQSGTHMILDSSTLKNLELVKNIRDNRRSGTLLDIIDLTVNPLGGRLLKTWLLQPLMDVGSITERQNAVSELLSLTIERHELRESFKEISDLARLSGKISLAVAHARDLVSLKRSLLPMSQIQALLKPFKSEMLQNIFLKWDNAEDILEFIERSIRDEPAFILTEGGIIREGYNTELDELRRVSRSGKSFITGLEKKERERTGISSLKVRYNKVFGYYIDVTKSNLELVPADYFRKQITQELKEYEEKVLNAEARIGELEYNLFLDIRKKISEETSRLQKIALNIAYLDVLSALAELAARRSYFRPKVNAGDMIKITQGRHPVIEVTNEDPFIPNDTHLDRDDDQIIIITGPNMGGKSTYLRQVALICILAQMGSFVPAAEAEIGVVDRIFTRIGAMDFLSVGQSTFMVEMLETSSILNNTTARSLILLDEVGRGTSTFDGLSLAWAIVEYLHEKDKLKPKTLFATHYHELTELSLTMDRIKNYHVTVQEHRGDIVFLRKIVAGPSDQSYGIHVAKLAGIPPLVLDRAREILFNLEKKELDDNGLPKIAYRTSNKQDTPQFLLFQQDREQELLHSIKEKIGNANPESMTPLEALNLLDELKHKLEEEGK